MIRYAIACAMLTVPASAIAQTAPGPVTVEIIATGEVTVPAQRFRMSVTLTAKGKDEDAAKAKLAADKAKLLAAAAARGVREAEATPAPGGTSFMALFSSLAGRSKPTVTTDPFSADAGGEAQSIATETVQLDAPSRAVVADVTKAVASEDVKVDEAAIGLLDDYPAASRKAKADALVKAKAQALSYGEALGLKQAAIARISEKQDIMGGTLAFVSQIVGMFAPKTGTDSNDITVRETLTVEFRLSK